MSVHPPNQKLVRFAEMNGCSCGYSARIFACTKDAHQGSILVRWSEVPLSTAKLIAANRMNAQRSTGPKSLEGKAVSRFNAVTPSLTATLTLLPGEDAGEYESCSKAYVNCFPPPTTRSG